MEVDKTYDGLNRLTNITSTPTGGTPKSYSYVYNPANQRTTMTLGDGSSWDYEYDGFGQLNKAKRKFEDGNFAPGQQYLYAYDDIGNRTSVKVGGDKNGSEADTLFRTSVYNGEGASETRKKLNQIDRRTVPGTIEVMGYSNSGYDRSADRPRNHRGHGIFQFGL